MNYAHAKSIEVCFSSLVSSESGLSLEQVASKLKQYGENILPGSESPALPVIFLHQFINPLIYILLFASVITTLMQQYYGTIFILVVLFTNALIGATQEHTANCAVIALKRIVTSLVHVKRTNVIQEINPVQLVPGDIVLLESGNKVPADLRLIKTYTLKVDESLFTGESKNVVKSADIVLNRETPISERVNMVFAGTMVTRGRAMGLVVASGLKTEMGKIAGRLTEESRVQSPLIIRMKRFTMQIAVFVGVLIVIISCILYLQGVELKYLLLNAVGIAVAGIPEGLPVTLTIALAIGMHNMAKRNVIVRKLMALESLGACTLIASDKTGTLTCNKLFAEQVMLPSGEHFTIVAEGICATKENSDLK